MHCTCSERNRPFAITLPAGSNERPRQWFVLRRNYSHSAFNGGRRRWSAYSDIACRVCGAHWRTKGKFVALLETSKFFPREHEPKVEPIDDPSPS